MLLAINTQKLAISSEMRLVEELGCKLSNRINHFKQFKQFKTIICLIQKHLRELQVIESYNEQALARFRIEPYIEASQRIKNHLIRKNKQVKLLINDTTFGPYATVAQTSISKINYQLCKIQQKMQQALLLIQASQENSIDQNKTAQ